MRMVKVIFLLFVFLILFIAVWQNIPSVLEKDIVFRLDLYWVRWESAPIPFYLITPLCFFAGIAIMGLFDIGTIFRLRRRVKRLEKELALVSPSEIRSAPQFHDDKLPASQTKWDSVKKQQETKQDAIP